MTKVRKLTNTSPLEQDRKNESLTQTFDHAVIHFEIPAKNVEALSEFYKNLFGWKFERMPISGEVGDYWIIETKADMESPGANGGMLKKMGPDHRPVNYVVVESVDEFSKKIQFLGGKIIVPKTPIANMGAFAIGSDPEDNTIGIVELS